MDPVHFDYSIEGVINESESFYCYFVLPYSAFFIQGSSPGRNRYARAYRCKDLPGPSLDPG